MPKYDDASWHYGGDFPKDLPIEKGATHIGIFLAWCVENNMISDFQIEESDGDVLRVKNREITGAEFLLSNCDGKFTDEDLNELGNAFASDYYESDTDFGKQYGAYLEDYQQLLTLLYQENDLKFESFYHVEDTWELYDILKQAIDKRFLDWKVYKNIS